MKGLEQETELRCNPVISAEKCSRSVNRRISVAPMMDWTDRHCRYFLRGFSARVRLYTEMITAQALIHGPRDRLLEFDPAEHPVALQLGGSEPALLARAAKYGADRGYDEINLNCGCPSDRVSAGAFGACLMADPARVAACVEAMRASVDIPVTVKMRIGIVDGHASGARDATAIHTEADYARLHAFTEAVARAGASFIIVHARKAVLGGLSPKDNREIPPLRFDVAHRLRRDFPDLPVILNGGLRTAEAALAELERFDGVMFGREAYHHPQVLATLHARVYDSHIASNTPDRYALAERMADYARRELARGERLSAITRHMLGLYAHEPGAREFRRTLGEGARASSATPDLILEAASRAERAARAFAAAS